MQLKKICAVIFLILSSMSCKHGNSDVSISSSSSEDIEESSSEYIDLERDYSYNNGSLFKIKNITKIRGMAQTDRILIFCPFQPSAKMIKYLKICWTRQ